MQLENAEVTHYYFKVLNSAAYFDDCMNYMQRYFTWAYIRLKTVLVLLFFLDITMQFL